MNKIKKKTTKMRVNPEDSKKFFWVLLVFVLIIGIWIGVQGANQGMLTLATSAQGLTDQDGAIKVRIRALDASKVNESLYTIDQTAVVKDGQLKLRWQIPGTAKKKAAYIEVCALDKKAGPSAAVKKACIEEAGDVGYNKVSCPYYVPANSTGFSGQLNGWNKLDDSQKVGCSGGRSFSKVSSVKALASAQSPGIEIDGGGVLVAKNGKIEAKDVEQFVKDALSGSSDTTVRVTTNVPVPGPQGQAGVNGANGADGAAGIATVSGGGLILTGTNLSLDDSCAVGELLKWDGSNWGCAVDGGGSDSQTLSLLANVLSISGGNSVNLSGYLDNTDSQALSWVDGTRTLSLTGGGSVVISDSDTTYSAGNGLSLGGTTFSINSPTCAGTTKLTWNGTTFSCAADVDTDTTNFNVAAQGTVGSQNIASGDTVTFNNGTGTTATRSGSTVTYGLNNTAVTAASYAPSDNVNGSLALPQFTVDAQGRLTAASTTNVTLTGIANSQLTNSAITVNTSGGLSGGSSVSLGGSVNLTIDLSDAADANTATTSSGSGLEVSGGEIGLIRGCATGELLKYNSTSRLWACATDTDTDTDTGVTSVGAIDSQAKSANGAVISGTILYLQNADASNPGLVSTGTQTFAGDKTFNGNVIADANLTVNGDVVLGNAASDAITFTGEVRGASPLAFEGLTNDGVYTTFAITDPTLARTVTFPDRSGTVSLSGDTFTGDVTGTLNASGATALTIAANSVALGTDTTGDYVTNVTAGGGLTGSATGEGSTPTLAIVSSNGGIVVNADDITLTITSSADALSATTSSGSGLEVLASGLTLIQGCSDTQVLAWNETTDVWACSTPTTAVTTVGTIDSQAKSANGAVISGATLVMQNADASFPGLVSTSTQSFAGNKTFTGNLTTNGAFQVDGNTTLGDTSADTITFNAVAGSNLNLNTNLLLNIGHANTDFTSGGGLNIADTLTAFSDTQLSGDTFIGDAVTDGLYVNSEIRGASALTFEGLTNDNIKTIFAITDPTTSNKTITFPDATGTVCLQASASCAFISTTLADGQILIGNGSNVATAVTPSGDVTISNTGVTAIAVNAVALGTDTTGDYVASNTAGNGISVSGSAGEGWSPTIAINSPTCGGTDKLTWNGTAFTCASDVDTDTGVTSIGTIDSQTKSANGAVISGTSLVMQNADASFPGLVSTGTQAFAGDKTFTGNVVVGDLGSTYVQALNNGTISTAVDSSAGIANPLMITDYSESGAPYLLTELNGPAETTSFGLTNLYQTGSPYIFNITSDTINQHDGLFFANAYQSGNVLAIDSFATYNQVGLGDDYSYVTVSCGAGMTCSFGANGTQHNTTVGSTTGTSALTLAAGTGGVSLGSSGVANTIQIGNTTGAVAQTINIGTNATASSTSTVNIGSAIGTSGVTVACGTGSCNFGTTATAHTTTIGSTTGSSTTTIQSGTGNVRLQTAGAGTTGNIQVGAGGAGSTTPDLFVLDIKSDAGDPTGSEGAMYYNTSTDKFRCYQNGSWADCITVDTGVTSIGTIDSQTKSANGAVISSTTLVMQNADATYPGLVSTGTQTLAGAKTLTGNLTATGTALFQNATNSTSAFQINSAAGDGLIRVDTLTTENLITNGQFETNTTGWAVKGSSTISQTSSQKYLGTGSMSVATTAAANDGAKYDYALASQSQYTMTFYVKNTTLTSSYSTINIGRTEDGATDSDCATGQTINGAGWSKITCTFTTGNVTGTNHIYLKQTDAVARTMYIDSVELQTSTNLATNPDVEVDASGWGYYGSVALSQTASQAYTGSGSLQADTSGVGGLEGPTLAPSVQPNTTYTISAWVQLDAGTGGSKTFGIYKRFDSTDSASGTSCTTASLSPGTWTKMTCTFTTGNITHSTPFIAINTTDDGITPITFYVDNVSLSVTKWNSNDIGRISLNGAIDSPLTVRGAQDSTSALQVQQQNGTNILTVDTLNGRVGIGTAAPTKSLEVNGKILFKATNTDTDTFQIQNTSTTNNVAFNVAASTRAVTVGASTNTANGSLSVYGTGLVKTMTSGGSASAFSVQDSANANVLTVSTSTGNKLVYVGEGGIDSKFQIVNTSSSAVLDIDTATTGSFIAAFDNFHIQNSTGADMIFADGTNNRIIFGDSDDTSSANTALLVVDSASTANLPTGINGGIVYDTSTSKFKIYEGGAYKTLCNTTDLACAVGDGGVTSIGTIDSQTKSANGAVISGTSLVMQNADATYPGLVSTGTQTFAGDKAFNGGVTIGTIGTPSGQLFVSGSVPSASVGSVSGGTNPYRLHVQGSYAYVVDEGGDALKIYDISNPASPALVSSVSTDDAPYDVYVRGGQAYVVNRTSATLQVFDVSNPASPTAIGSVAAQGATPEEVEVYGNYAYVSSPGTSAIEMYDVSDPKNPSFFNYAAYGTSPTSTFVQGKYLYFTDKGTDTLEIYDISNPDVGYFGGIFKGTVSTGALSDPSSIFVQGKYAYITHEGADTLGVYNITDPTAPASVGTVSTSTGPKSVYVQGRYAYVANTTGNTLQIIDVSNPASPTSEGTVAASGATSVSVKGRYAYVAQTGSNTLDVYDVGGAYIQQLETGGIKTSSLDVSQALNVDGALTVNGASKITGDLQVQDSNGAAGLLVDTTKREVSLSTGWNGDLVEHIDPTTGFSSGTEPASVVVNGYMYVVGGNSTVQYGKIMADGSTPSVSTTTSLPASKTRLAAVAHNGYMYAIGGGTSNTVYFSRINADGTLGSWKSTTSLTTSGTNHSAAIYKGNLYVVSSGSGNPVIHAKINPDGTIGSWTTSSMTGGTRPQIVVVNSKLYEFSGQSTDTVQYASIGSDGTLSGVTTGSFDLPIAPYKTRPLFMNGYLYAFTDDLTTPQMYYAKVNSDGTIGSWNTSSSALWSSGAGSYNYPISAYNGYVFAGGVNYYTTGRTLVGGTLDLTSLGAQDMNGSAGVGASLNAGNTNIVGSLDVVGQTSLMQGLSVAGDVNVAGQAVFQNTTDSTSAFRVQTSGGNSIVSIDTATTPNLITNQSFELNTDGWAARTSATLTKNTTEKYVGKSSLQAVTGAAASNGVKYNYSLASTTTYSLSFYAKSGGTFTTMQVGRTDNGTTASETNCLTGQTVSTTNWTRYTCTFITGTTSGTPYIYIKQSDAAAHTYYIDGVQLEVASASTNFKLGGIEIDGVLTSHLTMQNSVDSTGAFEIQNAAGTTLLGVDTINGKLFSTIADGASAVGLTFNTPSYSTSGAKLVSFQNNGTEKTYIDKDGNIDTIGGIQTDGSSILGDATTDTVTSNGSIIANASATGTTDTTSGTGTNTTTVTIVGTAFANGDVILIDNAGQDYYTRVTAGGGTSSLTVSPAVTFETARTVTKYNVQNVGATSTDYTTAANRFFQGYFLGGVVTGSGSTTLSDGLVSSTGGTLNLYGGGVDGASAVGLIVNTPSYTTSGAKLVAFQNNGVEKFYVDKDGNVDLASGAAYKINGSDICTSSGCAILATSGIQNQIGSDQTGDFRISGTGRANTSLQTPLLDTATATTLNIGTNNATDISLNKATTIASGLNFNALGKSKFKDATSEHDAFQVQNTSGDVLLNIGNAGYNPADTNLITNSNFENGGGVSWTNKNGGSVGGGGTNGAYSGSWWMTSYNTGVDDGTKYDVTLSPSTTYTFSAYVRLPSGSMSTLVLGHQDQSGTDIDCATSPSFADTDGWVRVSCIFTTGGTINNSNVYIKQSDASARSIYIDAAMLQARGYLSTYTMGDNFFAAPLTRGLIISGAYTQKALDVQGTDGASLFNVDSDTNVIGAGTTMNFLAPGYVFKNTADSGSAFQVQKSNGTSIFNVNTSSDRIEFTSYNTSSGLAQSSVADGASAKAFTFDTASAYSTSGAKLLSLQNNSVEKFSVDKDGNVDLASGAVYKINGTPGASATCSGGQILLDPVLLGGLTTSGTCTSGAVTSIGTIDSQTKSANGAVISGNTLVLQNADATYPGLVSTGTQTFAGDKTFNGGVTIGTAGTPTGQLYVSGSVPAAASGSVATATAPVSMYVQGKYAYVANMTSATLTVYDISNPASPSSVGSVATGTSPRGVYVQGKYAYVTNYTSATLTVYDISNPVSPTSVGSVATGNGPYNVHVQGKYAYVTNYTDSTLDVYDISNPASPSSVGSVATGASPFGINVQGKYAYVTASGSTTMESYDISNPVSPTSVGSVMTGTSPQGIYVQGKYAYVTNTGSGSTSIVNISNPASMSVISSPSTTNPRSVYVQGKYAYVANGTANTIQVLDISNPASVTSLGTMSTDAIARGVFVQGRYAYAISQTGATLQVYDVGGSYLQQLEAGGIETSTLSSLGNVSFGNNADIQGGLTVAGNTQFSADLGVSGKVSFQNVGTTTTAFTLTANSLTSGNGFAVENTGTGLTGNLFSVTSGSTSALTNGVVRYNFTGAHTGNGVQIDDVTTTGTVYKMNANSLTSGNGLVIANTGTGLTGNLFSVTSGSTSALTNGVVRYNFTGAHTGVGVQVDDATTTGTVYKINASALTTGTAFQVTGPSGKNFMRILYEATDPLDTQRVIIGGGGISASKPDSLARDQLYVFGRINYSWNMFTQDFLSGNPAVAADGLFMNGYYDENIGTGGTSPSGSIAMQNTTGASGMARLTFTGTLGTGPWASNWGTGGNLVTERSLNPVFEARVQASSNTDVRHIVGFTDMALNATTSADTNNSANEVFFRKTAAGTNWEAVSRNGSGTEEVTTLATACAGSTACTTTALRTMRIELENVGANGTARFYIDGTLVATHTSTAVPANTNRLGWLLTNTPTTTTYSGRTLDMDYVRVWSDDPPSSIAPGDVGQNDGVEGNTNTTENGGTPAPEDNSNEALLGRIKTLEENVSDLNQYKDVLTTEAIGESSLKKAIFIADVEFRKQVEFSADALFKANVNVDGTLNANGRVVVSNNTGTITIQPGQTEIQVLFAKSLQGKPNVFLSTENPDVKVVAQTRTKDGFIIKLSEPIVELLDVQWFAVERE